MNEIMNAMRRMAWQRAKGELLSILETYHSGAGFGTSEEYNAMAARIGGFIRNVEDNW
jgi:hypothetical protein